jgi:hypothetical protein
VTTGLGAALEPITRVRGVRGAMIVSATEGILVAEDVMEGVDAQAVAALAAGLAARLRRHGRRGRGAPVFIHLRPRPRDPGRAGRTGPAGRRASRRPT